MQEAIASVCRQNYQKCLWSFFESERVRMATNCTISEMTYDMSSGELNLTNSPAFIQLVIIFSGRDNAWFVPTFLLEICCPRLRRMTLVILAQYSGAATVGVVRV